MIRPGANGAPPRPLASVIVNNFDYARFLPAAIDSALGQTYAPLEVVVVDDGSSDDSRAVIERYGDRVVPVLKANGGQASAFNAGFAASRGEVVVFLDADDVLLPTALERAVPLFAPGVGKVHWPLLEIDAAGRPTGGAQPPYPLAEGDLLPRTLREGPLAGDAPPTSGNAWSRALLERLLPMPEEPFRISADGYLIVLSWLYGRVRTLAEPQALYRVHGDNLYVAQSGERKRERYLETFLVHCDLLAARLEALGHRPDAERWRVQKGLCPFPVRVAAARAEIAAKVPPGARWILADGGAWDGEPDAAGALAGRTRLPLAATPEDGDALAAEVAARRAEGADYVVFPWATRDWPERSPALGAYLGAAFPRERLHHVDLFHLRWPDRVEAARGEMAALLPAGARYVLVDDEAWSGDGDAEAVAGRRALPFLERDGRYWGRPDDDAAAIAELDRLRTGGADFIVFPWFAFWWLEHYPGFAAFLDGRFRRASATDHILAFDLRSS